MMGHTVHLYLQLAFLTLLAAVPSSAFQTPLSSHGAIVRSPLFPQRLDAPAEHHHDDDFLTRMAAPLVHRAAANDDSEPGSAPSRLASKGWRFGRRLLRRFLFNTAYVVTIPFPDLRRVILARANADGSLPTTDAEDNAASMQFKEGLVGLVLYMIVGVIAYHRVLESWSVVDALYFTCVCFSTVGYGDVWPSSSWLSKIFTCGFGFAGIALLGAAVAAIGSKLNEIENDALKVAKQQGRKRILGLYEKMPDITKAFKHDTTNGGDSHEVEDVLSEMAQGTGASESGVGQMKVSNVIGDDCGDDDDALSKPRPFASIRKAIRLVGSSLIVVAGGGTIIGLLEGWSVMDSIYYGLITASTIGFGDFAPQTREGRIAAIFFIPMAVASAGEILASIGLSLVAGRQKRLFREQLSDGLTMDHLNSMDTNEDGLVDREEYVQFMLMEMGLVTQAELDELHGQFDRLDVTRSGTLNEEDLRIMAQIRDGTMKRSV